jgi:hypothetical protein
MLQSSAVARTFEIVQRSLESSVLMWCANADAQVSRRPGCTHQDPGIQQALPGEISISEGAEGKEIGVTRDHLPTFGHQPLA